MCGIAGSFSDELINNNVINLCLSSMVERGPDNQNFLSFKFKDFAQSVFATTKV